MLVHLRLYETELSTVLRDGAQEGDDVSTSLEAAVANLEEASDFRCSPLQLLLIVALTPE